MVNNCQNLSEEAGNSLLKIVEEPPLDTVIILIAESSRSVLPTIVSRCRKINSPIPAAVSWSGFCKIKERMRN